MNLLNPNRNTIAKVKLNSANLKSLLQSISNVNQKLLNKKEDGVVQHETQRNSDANLHQIGGASNQISSHQQLKRLQSPQSSHPTKYNS